MPIMENEKVVGVISHGDIINAQLDEREYDGLLQWLARNPMAGPVIKGTGGLRKLVTGIYGEIT